MTINHFNTEWVHDPGLRHYMANQLMKLAYNLAVKLKDARQAGDWTAADTYRDLLKNSMFVVQYRKDGTIIVGSEPYMMTVEPDHRVSLPSGQHYPDEEL